MSLSTALSARSSDGCELCTSTEGVQSYIVPPKVGDAVEEQIAVCSTCLHQIENPDEMDTNHWRCLNDSMWNPEPAVQVMAFRMLTKLNKEGWAQDLLGMIYMEDSTTEWANQGIEEEGSEVVHKDSNGHILQAGDTVVLIKDLNVKGAGFIAKRGTAVRRISLVQDNPNHIQGRINDQTIIILTQYVKKS